VVDDHALIREGIRCLIDGKYHICGEAADGREAIQKVGELKPDLVILDINMPVMNGVEAAREIRRQFPGVKIVMLSLHEVTQLERDANFAGADAALSKSRAHRELTSTVDRLLQENSA